MGEAVSGLQIQLDRSQGYLRRRQIDPAGAQEGDVLHPGLRRRVEKPTDLSGEVDAVRRRHQIDPVDLRQRVVIGARVIPVETCVSAPASCRADNQSLVDKVAGNASTGLAGTREDENCRS